MKIPVSKVYPAREPIRLYAGWPMYGVDCATPPHNPATNVAIASVRRIVRVLKLSPATRALSVTLMPPTTVSRPNGIAIGMYFHAWLSPSINPRVGMGSPKCRSIAGDA